MQGDVIPPRQVQGAQLYLQNVFVLFWHYAWGRDTTLVQGAQLYVRNLFVLLWYAAGGRYTTPARCNCCGIMQGDLIPPQYKELSLLLLLLPFIT